MHEAVTFIRSYEAKILTGLRLSLFFLKRPSAWLLGVLVAAAAAYLTTTFDNIAKRISSAISLQVCRLGRSPAADNSRFTVLISPLSGDQNGSQTNHVVDTFRGERAFRVVPICESLSFDNSTDLETAEEDIIKRGVNLISRERADLLLFGEVILVDKNSPGLGY